MEPQELRIGNWAQHVNRGEFQIKISHFVNSRLIAFSKPIPITEERLKEFGFEYDEGIRQWEIHNYDNDWYYECQELENGEYINSVNNCEYTHGKSFQYIHQLQNLYFALTGKELTKTK